MYVAMVYSYISNIIYTYMYVAMVYSYISNIIYTYMYVAMVYSYINTISLHIATYLYSHYLFAWLDANLAK